MVLEHIQKLLFEHDCVIIPDFGGLITHYEPAKIHPVRHTFLPPAKRVAFNEKLKLNDGLLISTLAYDKQLPAEEAQTQVAQFVSSLQSDLNQNRRCDLKGVGIFRLNSANKVEFEYIENENYLLDSFGLPELLSKPVIAAEPVILRTLLKTPETPVKRGLRGYISRYYRVAAALAIGGVAVTGLYFLSLQTDYNVSAINPVTLFQTADQERVMLKTADQENIKKQPLSQDKVSAEITLPAMVTSANWPSDTVVEAPIRIAIKPVGSEKVNQAATEAERPAAVSNNDTDQEPVAFANKTAQNSLQPATKSEPAASKTPPNTGTQEVKRNYTIAEINAALATGKAALDPGTTANAKSAAGYKPASTKVSAAPDKSAPVAKPATINTASERFYVIVNGYATYDNAERNRKITAKKGRPGQIIEPFGEAKLYRLAIANFATREQALQQLPQLKNKYGPTIWILKY